jgi:hypothetical protein
MLNLLQQLFSILLYQRNVLVKNGCVGEIILFSVFKLLVALVHEIAF